MAIAGDDGVVVTEIFVDRLGFGGRFDDDDVVGNGSALSIQSLAEGFLL